jgi:hypothetical protein
LAVDIRKYPWFGMHDNVNIAFKVYEQRLGNQSYFDSGMAWTIIIIKNPVCIALTHAVLKAKFVEGGNNPVAFKDIAELESKASRRLRALMVYLIFRFLVDTLEFNFDTYKHNDDLVFSHSKSTCQLETRHMFRML